ncbi:hypothetical protein [Patulibacter sp. SYSU D01012]|uniref:hypothetical protein n=1 Tax=Patulibacter sp. SYSU D01012 TaxID=2817381 RepID=UPI001B315D33|nr:hypothetical protein [Patulibacter sp. SYSU D01012]
MSERPYTAEQVDAAVREISEPGRLRRAEEVVTHAVPNLQKIIDSALHDGGWFSQGHEQQVAQAAGEADLAARRARMEGLIAEESRLAMLVGVTVGFALARELAAPGTAAAEADAETTE